MVLTFCDVRSCWYNYSWNKSDRVSQHVACEQAILSGNILISSLNIVKFYARRFSYRQKNLFRSGLFSCTFPFVSYSVIMNGELFYRSTLE